MKKEIISHLSEILTHDDIYQAKRELKHLFYEYEKSKAEAIEEQKKIIFTLNFRLGLSKFV